MDKKNPIKIIGDAIREGRKKRGWTQKDLAAFVDVDTSLVSKWETYRTVPTGDDLFKIAIELDIVPILFTDYFPDDSINAPNLKKELEDIKKRLSKVEEKVLVE